MTKAEMKELIEALADEVKGYIDERIAALPAPKAGPEGPAGPKGEPGIVDPEMLRLVAAETLPALVERAQNVLSERVDAALPQLRGKDGADGRDGKDGIDGKDGPAGKDGRDGLDGKEGPAGKSVELDEVLRAWDVKLLERLVDVERRSVEQVQRAIDALPRPRDGVDGLSIEDLEVDHDGDGNVTLRFARGEIRREFKIRLGRFKDRGVFREDVADYLQGDGVSFGGSFWIAQKDAPEGRPGTVEGQWRLAVKKGRDGKDGGGGSPAPAAPVRLR